MKLLMMFQIQNVDALISNRFYRGVVDIYLDNNQITNIDNLEGAYWLSNFRVFSLKSNRLTQVSNFLCLLKKINYLSLPSQVIHFIFIHLKNK